MIRHEVVCDRCGQVWPLNGIGALDAKVKLDAAGWFTAQPSAWTVSGKDCHLCPPCYQSWDNWWRGASETTTPSAQAVTP